MRSSNVNLPLKAYFLISSEGEVVSTHLSLKELSTFLKRCGSFSQAKLRKDLKQGNGRVYYQFADKGRFLLREESL